MMARKQGFTLIELMVAIFLLALLIGFLISTLGNLQINNSILNKVTYKQKRATKMLTLLQADILQRSSDVKVFEGDKYISLEFQTTSSIYTIDKPYVRWFVDPKSKRLLRSESAYSLVPPYFDEDLYRVHLDEVATQCEWFKALTSNDSQSLLIAMQCDNNDPYVLEVLLFK